MTLSFYLSWTPYAINTLLTMFGIWIPLPLLNVIAILLAKSGTVINPILYIFFNKDVSVIRLTIRYGVNTSRNYITYFKIIYLNII